MMRNKKFLEELNKYPGDVVIRVNSKDIQDFYKNRENHYSFDELHEGSILNSVTLTIIAETLEETAIVVSKLNGNVSNISDEILTQLFNEFLKIKSDIFGDQWYEDVKKGVITNAEFEFDEFVTDRDSNETFKMRINGTRKTDKKDFSSQVIFRSNGGADEIIKALPLITNRGSFNRRVTKIVKND